jgi:DNA polymerase bacteriophage-type
VTVLSIDFETASEADLKKTGSWKYSTDPSTRVLCMAWTFDNDPVAVWRPGQPFPRRVADHVQSGGLVQGWNLAFEFAIWNNGFRFNHALPALRPEQLSDTMARAAYWGLPMSLDMAGHALGLSITKDKSGHKLMLQMCRPRAPGRWWHLEDPDKYDRLCDYCAQDVEAERALGKNLPPLPARERDVWAMDFRINQRGVGLDVPLIHDMMRVAASAKAGLDTRVTELTGGLAKSCNQTGIILELAQNVGSPIQDLRGQTVEERLPHAQGLERELLTLRRDAARASTAKLQAMVNAEVSGRVRGMLAYYGATRTGRWAGRLIQPQNLPRGLIKDVDGALAMIRSGATAGDLEMMFPVSALAILASCLRGCLVPGPGKAFASADLAQIEARVVAWLAGQQDILDVFASGDDVYVYTANRIGSDSRQLGKVLVLACGFGMGPPKFQATAQGYRLALDAEQSEAAVSGWREANANIVQLWWDVDKAARRIAADDMGPIRVGFLSFYRRGKTMFMVLPSGRELVYRNIALEADNSGREGITFDGVHQITKQWGRIRTYGGKLVENATQAVARDVMADALLAFEAEGLETVLSIHDEALVEAKIPHAQSTLDLMLRLMRTTPAWAAGLPVNAAGWVGSRYKKD